MSLMDDFKWFVEIVDHSGNTEYINITKAQGYAHARLVFESAKGRSVVLCRIDGKFIDQRIEKT